MEFAEHVTTLLSEGRALSAAVRRADRDAPVPTCPSWSVRDLVVHLGGVHRWATAIVGEGRTERPRREERAEFGRAPDDRGLVDWFDTGVETLADTLVRAEPGLSCWTFYPGLPGREFWARRQAHETLVHRIDAEIAAGSSVTEPAPALAADGLTELLEEFLPLAARDLVADPPTVLAAVTDHGTWRLRIGADGPSPAREGDDVVVRGSVAALHRFLWNRGGRDAVTVEGASALLDRWPELARI